MKQEIDYLRSTSMEQHSNNEHWLQIKKSQEVSEITVSGKIVNKQNIQEL